MDKKKEFIILLVIYFQFVISQDVLSIQSISTSNSTGISYFTSSILLRHVNNTPAASSFWTKQTPTLSWTVLVQTGRSSASLKMESSKFDQSLQLATSSSLETSLNSPTVMYFKTFSSPFHIYTSIETGKSVELSSTNELNSYSLDLKHYASKSESLNAFSQSANQTLNSLAFKRSTPLHGVISNAATSALSHKTGLLSKSTVDASISQFSVEQTKIGLQPLISASLPSIALSNISLSTSKTHRYQYAFTTIRTMTTSVELSQINITKSHQLTVQTKNSENYIISMNTTQRQSIFTSHTFESNSAYLEKIYPSSHTSLTDLISFNVTAVQPSHVFLESIKFQHSPALFMTSKSTKVYSTKSLSHHVGIFSSAHFSSTSSSVNIQRITKSFGFDSRNKAAASQLSSASLVSPTTKNPFSNIDVKKKNKKVTGFPAWIIILLCVGVVAAILIIVALAFKFIRWNKDHGDYSLWTSNLELQPITSRNTEVLT